MDQALALARLSFRLDESDNNGRRMVRAFWDGKQVHAGRFDPFVAPHRAEFCEAILVRVYDLQMALWTPSGPIDATPIGDKMIAAAEAPADQPLRYPVAQYLADVQPEAVEWLWPGRIALGKLTLLVGDPGLGKSFLLLDIAARVTTATKWPDCTDHAPLGGVILMSAEDDLPDTIRPRLDAAGADVAKIVALQAVKGSDCDGEYERAIDLQRDLQVIEHTIDTMLPDCRMVGIDPISSYMGKIDSHKNADVRSVLAPLAEFAARRRVCIVGVTHLRKGEGQAIHRTMGSLAFVAAARAAWAVTKDKRDPEGKRRLLLPIKNNIASDQSGLAFHLSALHSGGVPCIEWSGESVTVTADEALAPETKHRGRPADDRSDAEQWLRNMLADGPRPAIELIEEAREARAIAKRTLDRARATIRVVAYQPAKPGPWYWRLPDCQNGEADPRTPEFWHSGNLGENTGKTIDSEPQNARLPEFDETGRCDRNGHDPDVANRLFDEAVELNGNENT